MMKLDFRFYNFLMKNQSLKYLSAKYAAAPGTRYGFGPKLHLDVWFCIPGTSEVTSLPAVNEAVKIVIGH